MPLPDGMTIEVVRGRLDDEMAERLIAYWRDQGALDTEQAQRRLPEVICVLHDADGEVAGVNSVYRAEVGMIAGLPFWVYRSHLRPGPPPEELHAIDAGMTNAAFEVLAEEHDPTADMPVGLCVPVPNPDPLDRPRLAWSPETEMAHAGFAIDGTQLRIRYFLHAVVG